VACEVEFTPEFEQWWNGLTSAQQGKIDAHVRLLEEYGPNLGFPYSSGVHGSRYPEMRELRVQSKGRPIRVLYAFDPRRTAILLIGGDKTGQERWYERYVPEAETILERHLKKLKEENDG
jgi:hypothetical protein